MKSDKEIKKEFKKTASSDPDKYYPVKSLKEFGFMRKQCKKCKTYFWTTHDDQDVCGDSQCSGGFRFFDDNPAKNKLSYVEVWKKFSKILTKLGYTPIKRYPVVARWRNDMDFVIASIADFQPYVVNGVVEPPANPLVVPQFCFRFIDIDNVGITGSHMTCFNMIGQHMFVPPSEWDQERVFQDIKKWLNDGLGLDDSEITFHEDVWAGGGNFGPSIEFFSRGLEIGNQVYMMYEQTGEDFRELDLKVLDMGMGMERCAWFAQATPTIYDAVFPKVMTYLIKQTGIDYDKNLLKQYVPYAGYLNVDEVDDIDKAWQFVADSVRINKDELRAKILPLAALYSIAEHTRGLLIAIRDGALPSNTGGGYNLRMLARRALGFIDKYNWDIKLFDVCKLHAQELKSIFPELLENLDDLKAILENEEIKYQANKQKMQSIIQKLKKSKAKITTDKLIELYDSNGIAPDMIKEHIDVKVPDNFYAIVSELHLNKTEKEKAEEIDADLKAKLDSLNLENEVLYYDDYSKVKFDAKVTFFKDKYVCLDKTAFYPTSGGQEHDIGTIEHNKNVYNVVDSFKYGNVIVHVLDNDVESDIDIGDKVKVKINFETRKQLTQNHTATHIINAAAKDILGNHINQAGAKKTVEKAHIDLTHFKALSDDEIIDIEQRANEIVNDSLPVNKSFIPRTEAEQKFGMRIYQGGAVPGKVLRIIEIPDVDVEACGGTHLNNTKEAELIKIISVTKVQDDIVRVYFVAGNNAKKIVDQDKDIIAQLKQLLDADNEHIIPCRAEELFTKWKKAKKLAKKDKELDKDLFELDSYDMYSGDILKKTAELLKTQPQHLVNTVQRFKKELYDLKR